MPFISIWMDLEIVILTEVRERQISYDITYMWNLKKKKTIQNILFTKQKKTHWFQNQTYGYQRGNSGVRDGLGGWDWHMHTTIYKIN